LPGKESKDCDRPFNAVRRLLDLALTTTVTEVHGDDEQRHEHPDDRYASPEHQRLCHMQCTT